MGKKKSTAKKKTAAKKKVSKTPRRRVKSEAKPAKGSGASKAKKAVRSGGVAQPKAKPKAKSKAKPKTEAKPKQVKSRLTAKDRRGFRDLLVRVHSEITGQISFLASDNLNQSSRDSSGDLSRYSTHMADQGTDNFDREMALSLVSTEQDALFEIEEALQRLDSGSYGVCEACGAPMQKRRLQAMPFARLCVQCKSASEKGKRRFRPLDEGLPRKPSGLSPDMAVTGEEE